MKSRAPLALMEQMVMLLVFALAAALCLQAFVRSDNISRQSEARDRAAMLVQSAAEAIQSYGGDACDAFAGAAELLATTFHELREGVSSMGHRIEKPSAVMRMRFLPSNIPVYSFCWDGVREARY